MDYLVAMEFITRERGNIGPSLPSFFDAGSRQESHGASRLAQIARSLFSLGKQEPSYAGSFSASRVVYLRAELLQIHELLCQRELKSDPTYSEDMLSQTSAMQSLPSLLEQLLEEVSDELIDGIFRRKEDPSQQRRLEEIFLSENFLEFLEGEPSLDQESAKAKISHTLQQLIKKLLDYSKSQRMSPIDIAGIFDQTPTWWTGTQSSTVAVISQALRVKKLMQPTLLATGRALHCSTPLCGEWGSTGLSDYGVSLHSLSGVGRESAHIAFEYATTKRDNPLKTKELAPFNIAHFPSRAAAHIAARSTIDGGKDPDQVLESLRPSSNRLKCMLAFEEEDRWFRIFSYLGQTLNDLNECDYIPAFTSTMQRGQHILYQEGSVFTQAIFAAQHYHRGYSCILTADNNRPKYKVVPDDQVYRCTREPQSHGPFNVGDIEGEYAMLLTAPTSLWKSSLYSHLKQGKREFNESEMNCIEKASPIVFGAQPKSGQRVDSHFFLTRFQGYQEEVVEQSWEKDAVIGKDVQWMVCFDHEAEHFKELLRPKRWSQIQLKTLNFEEFALLHLLDYKISFSSFDLKDSSPASKKIELLTLMISLLSEYGSQQDQSV